MLDIIIFQNEKLFVGQMPQNLDLVFLSNCDWSGNCEFDNSLFLFLLSLGKCII